MPIDFASDMANVFLAGDFGETISWRPAPSGSAAVSLLALVDRRPRDRREEAQGRYIEGEVYVRIAVADLPSPGRNDSFALADGALYNVTAIEGPHEGACWFIQGMTAESERRGPAAVRGRL